MRKNHALRLLPVLLVLAPLALIGSLTGCKDFSFYGVLGDRIDDTPLQISPSEATIPMNGTLSFAANGGKPPYTFAVLSPGTGTIDADGHYTASGTGGIETVRVTDSKGRHREATITVTTAAGPLAINPAAVSLSPGGSLTFIATGGEGSPPTYTFTWVSNVSGGSLTSGGAYTAGPNLGVDKIQVSDGVTTPLPEASITVAAGATHVEYELSAWSITSPLPYTGGDEFSYSLTIQNTGTANGTQPVSWWLYISDDGSLGSGDTLLGSGITGALASLASTLPPITQTGTWPRGSGSKTLFVMIAAEDDLTVYTSAGYGITLDPPKVNYVLSGLTLDPGTTAGGSLSGTFDLTNNGSSDGSQPVNWTVYVSTNNSWEATDPLLDAGVTPKLNATFSQLDIPFDGTWPAAAATYFVIVKVTASDEPSPADTTGNSLISPDPGIDVTEAPIDYRTISLTSTGRMAGGMVSGNFTLENHGTANGTEEVFWTVYASAGNNTLEIGTDAVVDAGVVSPPPTISLPKSASFSGLWPITAGPYPASYYLLVKVSCSEEPAGNTTDNLGEQAVSLDVPDYDVPAVSNPTGSTATGGSFTGSFTLRNQGSVAGSKDVTWTVYASKDNNTLELGTDVVVDAGTYTTPRLGPIPATPQTVIPIAGTWPAVAGDYWLIVRVAAADERDSSDNTGATSASVPVTDQYVDYQVTAVNNTGPLVAGGSVAGNFSVKNTGAVNGAQTVYWQAYASYNNSALDVGDSLIASGTVAGSPLDALEEVTGVLFSGTWPQEDGPYYLIVLVSALDDANTGNNQRALSLPVTVTPPDVDYDINPPNGTVTHTGGIPLPGATVTGNFTFKNTGTSNGSQPVTYLVYASLNQTLDTADVLVCSSNTGPLNAGLGSGSIGFAGYWPLTYGEYYLIVRLVSAEDLDTSNNTYWTGSKTPVGIFMEKVEPNGEDLTTFTDSQDLGITLQPGMSVKVTGTMTGPPNPDDWDDVFKINTGTAQSITVSFTITKTNEALGVWFYQAGGTPSDLLYGLSLAGTLTRYSLSVTWNVTAPHANSIRYVDLYNAGLKDLGSYTCIIRAD